VCRKIKERESRGRRFSIVVVAEGARPRDGSPVMIEQQTAGTSARFGGIGEVVAHAIGEQTGKETRSLVLGHLQRGGPPTAFDRLIGLRFGAAAIRAVSDGSFGIMLGYHPTEIHRVLLEDVVGKCKTVPLDSDTIRTARELGVSLGDA